MSFISIGDLAQSLQFRRDNGRLNAELQRLTTELSTGRLAEPRTGASGDLGPLAGLQRSMSALDSYRLATIEAGLIASSAQASLGRIAEDAQALSGDLLVVQGTPQPAFLSSVGTEARQKFNAALDTLNTTVAGRSVFAGQAFSGPAVADAATVLADISAAIATAGATTAADIVTVVDTWFAPGGGFETTSYLGSADAAPTRIGQDQTVEPAPLATDAGIAGTLSGIALAALLDGNLISAPPDERAGVAVLAGERLLASSADIVALRAELGTTEEEIDQRGAIIQAERSGYEIALNDLVAADPFETASDLRNVQSRLEALYLLSGRLSSLSLANYLR